MRIIQVFNRYLERGGEEMSVERIAGHLELGGHQVERFWRESTEWTGPNAPSKWSQPFLLANNAPVLSELEALHRRFQPDLWLLHNILPVVSLGVYGLARELRIPVINWVHNYRPFSPSGTMQAGGAELDPRDPWIAVKESLAGSWRGSRLSTAWLAAHIAQLRRRGDFLAVNAWVATSEMVKRNFAAADWFPDRLAALRNAWDIQPTAPTPADAGYFLFLGRIVPEKGLEFLLKLFAKPEMRGARLLVAGTGPDEAKLRAQSPRNVEWVGFVGGAAKRELIRGASLVLFPSLWKEPFGLVAYEAYEQGRPIAASSVCGMTEVIEDGVTGRVLPPGDEARWLEVLTWSLHHPQALDAMGRAGRAWLEENATPQRWIEGFERLAEHRCGIYAGKKQAVA